MKKRLDNNSDCVVYYGHRINDYVNLNLKENMKNLTTTMSAILFAGAATTATAAVSTTPVQSTDVSIGTSVKLANSVVSGDLTIGVTHLVTGALPIAGTIKINSAGTVSGYTLGTTYAGTTISFGKQGDIFKSGGLSSVGGNTLANPAASGNSLITSDGTYSLMTSADNMQLAATHTVANITTQTYADFNFDNSELMIGGNVSVASPSGITTGLSLSYDDAVAYEAQVSYANVTTFVNGDTADFAQHIGVGYTHTMLGADVFAETSYDLTSKKFTPVIGVSYSF